MSDGRHFGEGFDVVAGGLADAPPPSAFEARAGHHAPDALARLVEAEILPRLMLAHRRGSRPPARAPSPDEIARFSALLLGPGPVDIDGAVDALLDGGLSLDALLLELLAPAARHLGALWEEDECDFLAVTEGLGRLHAITRSVCARLETGGLSAGPSVLLMPCPGETHVYGLSVVASFFREAGWDVTTLGRGSPDPIEALREGWYDVLGVSLASDVLLPTLKAAVPALRRASRNPSLSVLVGGPWFERAGAQAASVGADACAVDGRTAPSVAEALLDRPAVAC